MDQTFEHALYFFFMTPEIVKYPVSLCISIVTLIMVLTLLKKWGDLY